MRKGILISPLLATAVLANICLGQTAGKPWQTLKDKYHVVQIGSFDVQSGIDVPHEYVEGLPQELAKELKGSKKFSEVLLPGENPSQKDSPVLRLSGTITGFEKGNRGKRYIGLGMGAARIFITLDYVDLASGQLITEDKAFGELSGGLFGGDPKGVVKELAKSIAGTTKLVILRNLSTPPNVISSTPTSPGREASERQIVPIKASDLTGAQNKINELAAAGYRLLDFKVTGNRSAEIAMEKSAAPPDTYRYLLLHALSPGNVQKNLNKGAADGYRLVPHTLAALGAFAVIMEKPPGPAQITYEYRFRTSMRLSNAEKNVAADQLLGFILVESGDILGQHVVVTEKPSPLQKGTSSAESQPLDHQ